MIMIGLYTAAPTAGGSLLMDITPFVDPDSVVISTNERGFEALEATIRRPLRMLLLTFDQNKTLYVGAFLGASIVWEGRLEYPKLTSGSGGDSLAIKAIGAWGAFSDMESAYTSLWSTTDLSNWRPVRTDESAPDDPTRNAFETNNGRLQIAPQKNGTYGTPNINAGALTFETPDSSSRDIVGVSFDYELLCPVNWRVDFASYNRDYSGGAVAWTLNATGAVQRGSLNLTFTGKPRLRLVLYYTAAAAIYAGETGANYLRITNLRIVSTTANRINTTLGTAIAAGTRTVTPPVGGMARIFVGQRLSIGGTISESVIVTAITSTTFTTLFTQAHLAADTVQAHLVYADEIAKDLVAVTNALNSTQISSDTTLIQSPSLDLTDEVYEDATPADILTRLAELGDNQTTPRIWECAVWEGRRLVFQPQGTNPQAWYVDVNDFTIERPLDVVANSVLASYDGTNQTARTARSTDAASLARYGITRQLNISTQTSSSVLATAQRDAVLQDRRDPTPRGDISFDRVQTAAGAIAFKAFVRASSTLVLRNLPPAAASSSIDRMRRNRISRTEYHPASDELRVEPETPLPTIDFLLARRAINK